MLFQFLLVFVNVFFQAMTLAIFGRVLLSWFPIGPGNPIFLVKVVLHQITEPILGPLRRVIPTIGFLDLSPIVALLLLQFLQGQLDMALRIAAQGF